MTEIAAHHALSKDTNLHVETPAAPAGRLY